MDVSHFLTAYITILIFIASVLFLLLGGILPNLFPIYKELKKRQEILSKTVLTRKRLLAFQNKSLKDIASVPLRAEDITINTDNQGMSFDTVQLAKAFEIVNYPEKRIAKISLSIRIYCFILAIGTMAAFLFSIPEGQTDITYNLILETSAKGTFKIVGLTDFFALLFICHKFYLEIDKIDDLINQN